MINAASTTTSQEAINQVSTHFLLKPNYENYVSTTSIRNDGGLARLSSHGSRDVELPRYPIQGANTTSKEEENPKNYGEATTPLQHMMIKQYLHDVNG